jgi:phosphatidylinositol alpha-mannosyltransferase
MKIGIVCPYAWDSPGGVVAHIHDLALALIERGHEVDVLAPAEDETLLPSWVTSVGKPRAVPYNGSVAKVSFGPIVARRVSKWIEDGQFDVLHVHEPLAPSTSALACWAANGPVVATWHMSLERSKILLSLWRLAQSALEKVSARIAVSPAARNTMQEFMGGDAVIIPNGVNVASFAKHRKSNFSYSVRPQIMFLGRIDEPRKGLSILLQALDLLAKQSLDFELIVVGPGEANNLSEQISEDIQERVQFIGRVSDEEKARLLGHSDLYIAPNTGGESFGIVLLEAMAAGTPVLASDIPAFSAVLDDGQHGMLFENTNAQDLADKISQLLSNQELREQLAQAGISRAAQFDWANIVSRIETVYESVVQPGRKVVPDMSGQLLGQISRPTKVAEQ